MKANASILLFAAATLTMTGCVNIGSFNSGNKSDQPKKPGAAATVTPSPTPAGKAKAKPSPTPVKAPPRPGTPQTTPTSAAPQAPAPKPTPRVIHEESSTTIKVLESRPVVGSDAQMGN